MFLYPICQEENSIPVIFLTAAAHPTENRPRRRDRRGKIAAKIRKDRETRAQIPNIPGMIFFSIRYVKRKILFRSFFFNPPRGALSHNLRSRTPTTAPDFHGIHDRRDRARAWRTPPARRRRAASARVFSYRLHQHVALSNSVQASVGDTAAPAWIPGAAWRARLPAPSS